MIWLIVGLIVSYLLGSVPFGLLIGFCKGVDVRLSGSKNIGATNVARVLGSFKWFVLVFILDFFKGFVSTLLFSYLALEMVDPVTAKFFIANPGYIATFFGLAAILGHMYPIYLKFKGGKGVATGAGVVVALTPISFAIAFVIFMIIFLVFRYVSLSSILASFALIATHFIISNEDVFSSLLPVTCFYIFITILIIVKHRANIKRLLKGEELKVNLKSKKLSSDSE